MRIGSGPGPSFPIEPNDPLQNKGDISYTLKDYLIDQLKKEGAKLIIRHRGMHPDGTFFYYYTIEPKFEQGLLALRAALTPEQRRYVDAAILDLKNQQIGKAISDLDMIHY